MSHRLHRLLIIIVVMFAGLAGFVDSVNTVETVISVDGPNGLNRLNGLNEYRKLYQDLLYPSVKITAGIGIGSGVVISATDKHGYTLILTAAHVVGNESTVTATFYSCHEDTKTLSASVVITDTVKDLALLRITHDTERITHHAKLAPRNYTPYIFTPVYAVGCSLGLPPRPSSGIITAISRHQDTKTPSSSCLSDFVASYWEISAPIAPGNSGGGVFLKDTRELIGIAVWVRGYREQLITTMAGIVPLQDIYEFLDQFNRRDAENAEKTNNNFLSATSAPLR